MLNRIGVDDGDMHSALANLIARFAETVLFETADLSACALSLTIVVVLAVGQPLVLLVRNLG
jgi:hypothetical protein